MTQKVDCPMCHGEGSFEECVPGGRFDQRAEQWYPLEQTKTCPLCKGLRTVDKPVHDNLFNLTPDYQQRKQQKTFRRSRRNDIVLSILGFEKAA
jgi:hypothetical protein